MSQRLQDDRTRTVDRRFHNRRQSTRDRRLTYPGKGIEGRGPGCTFKIGLTTCGYAKSDHYRANGDSMNHEFTLET